MYNYPLIKGGLLNRLFGSAKTLNIGNILDGTQKTLGIINQAIPIVYQVKPIFQNAKTMFRIADEIRKPNIQTEKPEINIPKNKPIFYI